jgi:membrane associated rhomboid family serine protease
MPDLPRQRAGRPSWTQPIVERLTPGVKVLVVVSAFVYFFYVMVRPARPVMEAHLVLGPGLFAGQLWQPLTSLFVHLDPLGFIFDLVGLWFVGATIERSQGTRRFLFLFLGAGVLANLAIAAAWQLRAARPPAYLDGCSYAVLALFVAFGRMYGRAPAQLLGGLALRAQTIAFIFVGWAALANVARGDWPGLAGTVVTVLVGVGGGAPGGLMAWRLRRRHGPLRGDGRKSYVN